MHEREILDIQTAHGGYTVSAAWQVLAESYPDDDTTFVLFKEDPAVIEDHFLYGYYHNFYAAPVLHDYRKYLKLNLENGELPNVQNAAKDYYGKVENYFRGSSKLVVADLGSYGGSWNNWMLSDDFATFVMTLPASDSTLHLKVPGMQRRVLAKKMFPYFDYLTPGPYYGVPTGMAMGVFFGSFPMPFANDLTEPGYVDHLVKDYIQ